MPEQTQDPAGFLGASRLRSFRDLIFNFEFTLISCTYWRNTAPWNLEERSCPDSFFLFPLTGELRVFLNSKVYSVPPGRFLMLPEGTSHAVELKRGFRRLDQLAIHCHIHDRWGRPLLSRFPSFFGQLRNQGEFFRVFKELACLMDHDPEIGRLYGEIVLKELLVSQIRQGTILKPSPSGDHRVGLTIQRMKNELGSIELSIGELARGVNITSAQLRKLFRRATGAGPKQFLSALRLRKAARLLRHTVVAVKEVAVDCGFASDHYFHLAFRRQFGCTPSEYRTRTAAEV